MSDSGPSRVFPPTRWCFNLPGWAGSCVIDASVKSAIQLFFKQFGETEEGLRKIMGRWWDRGRTDTPVGLNEEVHVGRVFWHVFPSDLSRKCDSA